MLMESFRAWKDTQKNEVQEISDFSEFFHELVRGREDREIVEMLAWQIYQIQECLEGLMEDLDNGQAD